jgi:hypothetical protein
LVWVKGYARLELEEIWVYLRPNTAFHATEFLHFAAAAAAVGISQALQRGITRIIFQNFILNIQHHLLHAVPRQAIVQAPLRIRAVH